MFILNQKSTKMSVGYVKDGMNNNSDLQFLSNLINKKSWFTYILILKYLHQDSST
jgi:hypothetical protein